MISTIDMIFFVLKPQPPLSQPESINGDSKKRMHQIWLQPSEFSSLGANWRRHDFPAQWYCFERHGKMLEAPVGLPSRCQAAKNKSMPHKPTYEMSVIIQFDLDGWRGGCTIHDFSHVIDHLRSIDQLFNQFLGRRLNATENASSSEYTHPCGCSPRGFVTNRERFEFRLRLDQGLDERCDVRSVAPMQENNRTILHFSIDVIPASKRMKDGLEGRKIIGNKPHSSALSEIARDEWQILRTVPQRSFQFR